VLKGLHDGILGLELLISQGMNAAQSHPQNFVFFELMKNGSISNPLSRNDPDNSEKDIKEKTKVTQISRT
jgi:hypothetical protein